MMERCVVLFGSNMGDKEQLFKQACLLINNRCGTIFDLSAAYESEPWGFEAEEWFLNRAIVLETELAPEPLLKELLDIEKELGRVRHPEVEGYCSRTVDLDPRLHLRRFALVPLCDVIPDFRHPVFQLTQVELLQRCQDGSVVRELYVEKED